jgi:hypothetical protein
MGMQQILQHKNTPNLSIESPGDDNRYPFVRLKSNIALRPKIPFVHEKITLHANKYKLRITGHSNKLISELFYQSNDVRRLQRIWPEDLAK